MTASCVVITGAGRGIGAATEVATGGIRVNSVRLGIFDTDLHASGGQPDRAWRLAPMVPLRRPGDPAEAHWTGCRQTSPYIAWRLPPFAPRAAPA
jgi:NAD(P)-dependent dehydrogenase (short-subunit alcohol dehydrogenase family)